MHSQSNIPNMLWVHVNVSKLGMHAFPLISNKECIHHKIIQTCNASRACTHKLTCQAAVQACKLAIICPPKECIHGWMLPTCPACIDINSQTKYAFIALRDRLAVRACMPCRYSPLNISDVFSMQARSMRMYPVPGRHHFNSEQICHAVTR
jgi:hypothetical protein